MGYQVGQTRSCDAHSLVPHGAGVSLLLLLTAIATVAIAQEGIDRTVAKDSTPKNRLEARISNEDVAWAVQRAVDYLFRQQARDGRWRDAKPLTPYTDELTALAAYALYRSGVPPDNRRMDLALRRLLDQEDVTAVFARSYRMLLFSSIGIEFFEIAIDDDVHFLELHQVKRGTWGSGVASASGGDKKSSDVFHTRLALRALHEAARAGARVVNNVWRSAERSLLNNQNKDGGWGQRLSTADQASADGQASFGSTTADALSALDVIYEHRYLDAELPFNGRFKAKCGTDVEKARAIRQATHRAFTWLEKQFAADVVPGPEDAGIDDPIVTALSYYLSGLNRASRLTGKKRLDRREWQYAIAAQLIRSQRADGSWARQAGSTARQAGSTGGVLETCYALLALADTRAPLILSKLIYGNASQWNLDPRDAAHLTDWYGEQIQQPLSWQLVKLDRDKGAINGAPILLINGHEAPQLTAEQEDRLRSFVHDGGTVLAVACCSRAAFAKGSEELFTRLFPHLESGPLDEAHEVWNILNEVKPDKECIGFGDGCRTSIFLLSDGACCTWHQDLRSSHGRRFAMAGNILKYATYNRPLRMRWETRAVDPPVVALTTSNIATLQHGGDWWAEPGALPNLTRILAARNGVALTVLPPMTASQAADRGVEVLWLTGHTFGKLPDDDADALRAYLKAGGTLVVTACCGREAFDDSFQSFAVESFGEKRWVRIPSDDPLITGDSAEGLASSLRAMNLKLRYMGSAPPRIDVPIFHGVRIDDRWAVMYSPMDIACGIVGHSCLHCVGFESRDARAVAANMILYAVRRKIAGSKP